MKDSLLVGIALGLVAGAVLGAKNKQVEEMVNKGKQAVKKHLDK